MTRKTGGYSNVEHAQKRWTASDIQTLVELRSKGLTPSAIGKEMGRSRDSVRNKIKSMQLKGNVDASAVPKETVVPVKKNMAIESHSMIDYCPNCHSPVSNWPDHLARMAVVMGCRRPMA